MTNNTNDTITTGEHFRIEKFENNEWIDFTPKDIAFNDIGYELKPYGVKTFHENLFKNKIDYKQGKYRIVKYYFKSDYQQTNEDFNIYAEFEIN
nr:immunoglobulin-like domain-containing protein [uncultured Allomuricauda sp.]